MTDRKASFAKRQREIDLKTRARDKEARRAERRSQPRTSKGPEIAWDEAVNTSGTATADIVPAPAATPPPAETTDDTLDDE
jgi:hypothetical protein